MTNEEHPEFNRDLAKYALLRNLALIDGDYDDDDDLFFDVRPGDESLVVRVVDATDESQVEEFIITLA